MTNTLYVHAQGESKEVKAIPIKDGKVNAGDVKKAIHDLFNAYTKKVRENSTAQEARDRLIRSVDNATGGAPVTGKGLGQNVFTTNSFNNSDMRAYHMDIEFDTEVKFVR